MMLRKRQSWTVTWANPTLTERHRDPDHPGTVTVLNSVTGKSARSGPAIPSWSTPPWSSTPLEGGWELLP